MMSSCGEQDEHFKPLEHSLSSWLSTDYLGDEFEFFITDPPMSIMFRMISYSLSHDAWSSVDILDGFVLDDSYWKNVSGYKGLVNHSYYETLIWAKPLHVGCTYFRIRYCEHDTLIKVQVLPEYYTYTEPGLDFDDTEDSVRSKLANPVLFYDPENRTYQVVDVHGNYNLQIFYAEDGTIDHYVVTLLNHPSEGELRGYIEERYYYYRTTVNQLPIYIKAFNEHNPSISDATVVVILDLESSTITYQNPVTYNN